MGACQVMCGSVFILVFNTASSAWSRSTCSIPISSTLLVTNRLEKQKASSLAAHSEGWLCSIITEWSNDRTTPIGYMLRPVGIFLLYFCQVVETSNNKMHLGCELAENIYLYIFTCILVV
ncbi:unnamed protein product [Schistosoma bovis]|nr:unnamed protein product [Schistosoma bovis]CAH8576558.1 unnamed protein product [Schistosoma bovis]